MAKVLLFQCDKATEEAVRQILTRMKIKAMTVPKEKFHMSLEALEMGFVDEGTFGGAYPQESLLVMCDLTEKQMDKLLLELRGEKRAKVDYKAVLTPTNRKWDVVHLYFEMEKERAVYMQMNHDRNRRL